jgi:hypothetical protein
LLMYSADAFLPLFVVYDLFFNSSFHLYCSFLVLLMTIDGRRWQVTVLDWYEILVEKNEHGLGIWQVFVASLSILTSVYISFV